MFEKLASEIYTRAMEKMGMRSSMKKFHTFSKDTQQKILDSLRPDEIRQVGKEFLGAGAEGNAYPALSKMYGGLGSNGVNAVIKTRLYNSPALQGLIKNSRGAYTPQASLAGLEDVIANPKNLPFLADFKILHKNADKDIISSKMLEPMTQEQMADKGLANRLARTIGRASEYAEPTRPFGRGLIKLLQEMGVAPANASQKEIHRILADNRSIEKFTKVLTGGSGKDYLLGDVFPAAGHNVGFNVDKGVLQAFDPMFIPMDPNSDITKDMVYMKKRDLADPVKVQSYLDDILPRVKTRLNEALGIGGV